MRPTRNVHHADAPGAAHTASDKVHALSPSVPSHDGDGVRIGLFDSGLGGLSVLKAIRQHLPRAELLYVADSGHAPYGEREDRYIADRATRISDFLMERGVDALVVACNTATAAAVQALRQRWTNTPVIGVEPGVKPAVHASPSGRIGVLATPGTLGSDKFRRLVEQHAGHARLTLQPCPGLAKAIESGDLRSDEVLRMVKRYAAPLREAGVDTVVLGCTHYPFVSDLFQAELGGGVQVIDTAQAVAMQTMRVTERVHRLRKEAQATGAGHGAALTGATLLWSSGDPAHLSAVAQAWLGLDVEAQALPQHVSR